MADKNIVTLRDVHHGYLIGKKRVEVLHGVFLGNTITKRDKNLRSMSCKATFWQNRLDNLRGSVV